MPRPILTDGPCPTWMCAFLAEARVIDTVAIPLAGAFDVTRTEMPLRSTALRLCGSSCSRTWRPGADAEPEPELTGGRGGRRRLSVRAEDLDGLGDAGGVATAVGHSQLDLIVTGTAVLVIDARTGAGGAVAEVPLVRAVVDHQRRGSHRPVEQDVVARLDGPRHDEGRVQQDSARTRERVRIGLDRAGVVELALERVGVAVDCSHCRGEPPSGTATVVVDLRATVAVPPVHDAGIDDRGDVRLAERTHQLGADVLSERRLVDGQA